MLAKNETFLIVFKLYVGTPIDKKGTSMPIHSIDFYSRASKSWEKKCFLTASEWSIGSCKIAFFFADKMHMLQGNPLLLLLVLTSHVISLNLAPVQFSWFFAISGNLSVALQLLFLARKFNVFLSNICGHFWRENSNDTSLRILRFL